MTTDNFLEKLFEHNNWTNVQIIQICSSLGDKELDSEPASATKGTIRDTLWHLIASQQGYLSLLTGKDYRSYWKAPPPLAELKEAASVTGEGLLAFLRNNRDDSRARIQTRDGFYVEPWVLMVQVISHATEHREQIKSMLSALGMTPPDLDGWSFGEVTGALVPISREKGM